MLLDRTITLNCPQNAISDYGFTCTVTISAIYTPYSVFYINFSDKTPIVSSSYTLNVNPVQSFDKTICAQGTYVISAYIPKSFVSNKTIQIYDSNF